MPEQPFRLIRLKTPAGVLSEIGTAQAAIAFVKSLDPETRARLHWRLVAFAMEDLEDGLGTFEKAHSALHTALATEGWLAD
jgi:hypothetical protein